MTTSPALLTDAEMEQLCNGALPKTRYCRGFREYGRAVEAAVTARLKDALTASNERNAQLSRLLLDQDREGAALPFDAWAEYAMREGLLDMKGIATDRKTTGTAFAAFAAGWNAAKGAAVMEGDGGLSDGVMAVPANCRQCGRQLRLDGLCVECDYSDGVALPATASEAHRLADEFYNGTAEKDWPAWAQETVVILERAAASGVPEMQPQQGVAVETLRQHWLRAMECDHATGRDKPHCACSRIDLGWHPSIGAAVEAWLAHVSGVLGTLNDKPKGGA